ncbi:hypothetical protein X975_22499, partial [Stegodyphus mimosarum]
KLKFNKKYQLKPLKTNIPNEHQRTLTEPLFKHSQALP